MEKSYTQRFQKFSEWLMDTELATHARKKGLRPSLNSISSSESELAKQNFSHLKEMELKQPILVIFDRGYPAIEFVDYLESQGIHYLFRLSSNVSYVFSSGAV